MSEPCASVILSTKKLTLLPTERGAWVSLTVGLDVSATKLIHFPCRDPNTDRPSRNPVTKLGWAHLPGLRDMAEGALGMECLSPWGLCEGNLERGLPRREP
jgi:hypothetical protein